jgi:hypothetical protein
MMNKVETGAVGGKLSLFIEAQNILLNNTLPKKGAAPQI